MGLSCQASDQAYTVKELPTIQRLGSIVDAKPQRGSTLESFAQPIHSGPSRSASQQNLCWMNFDFSMTLSKIKMQYEEAVMIVRLLASCRPAKFIELSGFNLSHSKFWH